MLILFLFFLIGSTLSNSARKNGSDKRGKNVIGIHYKMRVVSVSTLAFCLLLLLSCDAASRWFELEHYTFEQYITEFRKHYSSVQEREFRRQIVENKLSQIRAHNRNPDATWKQGVNRFTDRTEDEFRQVLGVRKELVYQSRRGEDNIEQIIPQNKLSALPLSVDWRSAAPSIITPVKDQGECGSCWSFASASTIESYWAKATGELAILSEQNILSCTPNPGQCGGSGGCGGATNEIAFQSIIDQGGIASEWTYPYISYRGSNYQCQASLQNTPPAANITSYKKLTTNQYYPLLEAVATTGPLAITVDAGAWGSYETGIFNGCNQTNPDLNHAVQLVGYGSDNGQDYWLVRNSWSPAWGESGYIRLYRSSTVTCGTDITPLDGTACADDPSPVTVCGTCGILYDSSYPIV